MKSPILTVSLLGLGLLTLAGCSTTTPASHTLSDGGDVVVTDNTTLAQCLTAKGVTMYGADRCQHCAHQKKLFGTDAFAHVNYVECEQNKSACELAGVRGYPTWKLADGTALPGVQSLDTLAQQAGCLPGQAVVETTEQVVEITDEVSNETPTMPEVEEVIDVASHEAEPVTIDVSTIK